MGQSFLFEKDKRGICRLTLNRPDVHNAFNDEMISELIEKFKELNADSSARVLVIDAKGKSFCAGADLNWMKKMKDYSIEENYKDSFQLAELFRHLKNLAIPTIAKVAGAALGGGVGLVASCDYVIAGEDAKFGLTEVKLGLIPAVISPYVIEKIGYSQGRALFLTAEIFDGKKAKDIGLIHQISLDRYFDYDTEKVVETMLKNGPQALRAAKKLIVGLHEQEGKPFDEKQKFTCQLISDLRVGSEAQEGMTALLEKRKPAWQKDNH